MDEQLETCPIFIHWRAQTDNTDGFKIFSSPGTVTDFDYTTATCAYSKGSLVVDVAADVNHVEVEFPSDWFDIPPSAWDPSIPTPTVKVTCLYIVAYNAVGQSVPLQDVLVFPNGS